MIMQVTHRSVDFPICARAMNAQSISTWCELRGGECRDSFVIHQRVVQASARRTIRNDPAIERTRPSLRSCMGADSVPPSVVIIEHRDEVFARLASDVEAFGLKAVRARSAVETLRLLGDRDVALVVINRDLPGQNGWVLADRFRVVAPHVDVWLYMSQASMYAGNLAHLVKVSETVTYGGDLFTLSDAISNRLARRYGLSETIKQAQEWMAA